MILTIIDFIGRLHPVVVHLPIGILLLACLFLWQSRKDKSENFRQTINMILGLGMVSAIIACITGIVLSKTGEYEEGSTDLHQWMGISVALVSVATFYLRRKQSLRHWQTLLATILLVLIFVTGHLGGSLTHGSDYLTSAFSDSEEEDTVTNTRKAIPNVQEALAYGDIIRPIFQSRCYTCHGPKRQKGKLRLDQPDRIMKGGKDGPVIIAGNAKASELVKRILLPREDEHHMAPKDRKQLTESEKLLIQWWIDQGADFSRKVSELQQPDKLKPVLKDLEKEESEKAAMEDYPTEPVGQADPKAIALLRQMGILVQPIAQNNNYLEINFVGAGSLKDHDLAGILPLKEQLVSLRASGMHFTDSGLLVMGQCPQLVSLVLDHTLISDTGLAHLANLHRLKVLNLVGDSISAKGLLLLKDLQQLRALYVFHTKVKPGDWTTLKQAFPHAVIDTGGYTVPFLKTDTMVVKPPRIPG